MKLKVAKMKQAKILVSMVDRPTSVKKRLSGSNFKDMLAAGASTEEIAQYMQILMRGGNPGKKVAAASPSPKKDVSPVPARSGKAGRPAPPPPKASPARRRAPSTPDTQICSSYNKPSRDEFKVEIPLAGSKQLGMDLKVSQHGLVQIKGFYQGDDGRLLPVEDQGEILPDDYIVSVNGERFKTYQDCKIQLASATRKGDVLTLGVIPSDSSTIRSYARTIRSLPVFHHKQLPVDHHSLRPLHGKFL